MKKLAIASLIALATASAGAVELGVSGGKDFAGVDTNVLRFTAGVPVTLPYLGAVTASGEYSYVRHDSFGNDTYVAALTKSVLKAGPVDVGLKGAVGYIDPVGGSGGGMVGVGLVGSLPLTKGVSATAAVEQRWGQTRVDSLDGSLVTVGLKFNY